MKKLSDTFYVQEEGRLLIHAHGPYNTPWCLVDTGTGISASEEDYVPSSIVAMFSHLTDALAFAEVKESQIARLPGRSWHLVQS